jgi:putative heme-binding domain-containing protein
MMNSGNFRCHTDFRWLFSYLLISGILQMAHGQPAAATAKSSDAEKTAIAIEALSRLQGIDLNANPAIKNAVLKVLEKVRGTAQFVQIVKQFQIKDQNAGLLEVATTDPASEGGVEAIRLILASGDLDLLKRSLHSTNSTAAAKTTEALGNSHDKQVVPLLRDLLRESAADLATRKQAVRALAQTSDGAGELIKLAKEEKLADELKFTAGAALAGVRWPEIKFEAGKLFPSPQGFNAQPLPPVADLLKMKGNAGNGAKVFSRPETACINCHQVKGRGTEIGPNLSEIGTKLAKEALYEAILDPSAGISFGFEAHQLELKSGDEAYGLIVSETAEELALKDLKGIVTRYKKTEITKRQQSKLSIMPTGLQQTMSAQELVDLVEYLSSLKKGT